MMAGVTFSEPPGKFFARIQSEMKVDTSKIAREWERVTEQAAQMMRVMILEAVTPTGLRREALTGGHPGRYRSGKMYDSVSSGVSKLTETEVQAWYGWDDVLKYFIEQEHGTPKIQAVNSLYTTFLKARAEALAAVEKIVKGR